MENFRKAIGEMLSHLKIVLNFSHMSDKTKHHLTKVYTLLLLCAFMCALGIYCTNFSFLGSFAMMKLQSCVLFFYLLFKVNDKSLRQDSRMILLMTLAFMLGYL